MKRVASFLAIVVLLLGLGGTALAQGLDLAKTQGLVGERIDGYVGLVDSAASRDVRALVDRINGERRAEYERLARQQGVDARVVAQLVGERQIQRAASGTYIMDDDGSWRRK